MVFTDESVKRQITDSISENFTDSDLQSKWSDWSMALTVIFFAKELDQCTFLENLYIKFNIKVYKIIFIYIIWLLIYAIIKFKCR